MPPSETMDLHSLSSSSFLSEDASFPNERHLGVWKADAILDRNVIGKSVASSPLGNIAASNCQPVTSLGHSHSHLMRDKKLRHNLDRHAIGADRTVNQPFRIHPDHDLQTTSSVKMQSSSYGVEGGKVGLMGAEYENSLFSSSLSDLFTRNLRLNSSIAHYGHSVDTAAAHLGKEEPFESLEDIEAQTIGNLLPSDDDLFTGLTDKLDNINQSTEGNDLDELDFFNSVGGMDLGEDGSEAPNNSEFPARVNGQLGMVNGMAGEHPYGEHPSRTLFVRNIYSNIEDSELRALFEPYGDVRALYTACKNRGFVMVSYYDIRAARNAMKALQNQPLQRKKLDIHFSIPKDNPIEKDINQGTLVAFNLDSSVSNEELRQIFGVYGEIKEIRETPHRSHKVIEFYDVRASEAALRSLNRSDIAGKRIKLEPSRPGVLRRGLLQSNGAELGQDEYGNCLHQSPPHNLTAGFSGEVSHGASMSSSVDNGTILGVPSVIKSPFMESAFHHGISSSVPDSLPSLLRVESVNNQYGLAESGQAQGPTKIDIRGTPNFHPHSLPDYQDILNGGAHCSSLATNIHPNPSERLRGIVSNGHSREFSDGGFGSAGNGNSSLPGLHYGWSNSFRPQPPGIMWPNSPSFVNGISMPHPQPRMHGPPRVPPALVNPALPLNNHHVGSAPTGNLSLWDKRHVYAGESPDTSSFHPGSLGSMRITNNSLQSLEFLNHNIFSHMGGNSLDLPILSKNLGLQAHHQRSMMFPGRGPMFPVINSFDPSNERRIRRNDGGVNQAEKKHYELDVDRIMRGEDNRTTLMIKNIPNKYTSKMLLSAIDERHRGTYDFIYLPIDFKNKCNVGYAFINMIDPSHIIPFSQAFNGKKWEKFNSEKVASLAYARIQGRPALIAHFQNSSLMNEDKRCRPILFNTDGPNAGDQVPFPMGVNVRSRTGKSRNISNDENQPNREDLFSGDKSSSSGKESDLASDLLFTGTNLRAFE